MEMFGYTSSWATHSREQSPCDPEPLQGQDDKVAEGLKWHQSHHCCVLITHLSMGKGFFTLNLEPEFKGNWAPLVSWVPVMNWETRKEDVLAERGRSQILVFGLCSQRSICLLATWAVSSGDRHPSAVPNICKVLRDLSVKDLLDVQKFIALLWPLLILEG